MATVETLTRSTLTVVGAGAIGSAVIERFLAVGGVPAASIRAVETGLDRRDENEVERTIESGSR